MKQQPPPMLRQSEPVPAAGEGNQQWLETEFAESPFVDERIRRRVKIFAKQMAEHIGQTVPLACQDWANTKAAYRLLSNSRVTEHQILAGHFVATSLRTRAEPGWLLVLHDTTEFSYKRDDPSRIGILKKRRLPPNASYQPTFYTTCGILLHSSLAVNTAGTPLGICAAKFWTRDHFKGTNALKRKVNPTRIPIDQKESMRWVENLGSATQQLGEPERCVHIGDRESDIYELFCAARGASTHFVFRTCVDRLCDTGQRIGEEMKRCEPLGIHRLRINTADGKTREAKLLLTAKQFTVLPPQGKQQKYAPIEATVLHAIEQDPPEGEEAIDWKLITDFPVTTLEEGIEKLEWYSMRWKIEVFHKVMKSGCRSEESRLRTAQRLTNLLALFCIIAWRVFWLTMVQRAESSTDLSDVFTPEEMILLDHLVNDRIADAGKSALTRYMIKLARLGDYLARKRDGPPGCIVTWRGLYRLTDIHLGFLAAKRCG
jgi:Transposase DNA-binding